MGSTYLTLEANPAISSSIAAISSEIFEVRTYLLRDFNSGDEGPSASMRYLKSADIPARFFNFSKKILSGA